MKTDAFFSRWESVGKFAKPGKRSLILPREQPADIKVPLVALEAAVGEIVAQPAQLRPNLLHRHHFRVEIDREVLQVRAAHGVNPQRVAAPVQIARVVDVAVEIQIGVARLAHFGLQRAGHLGHGGGQTQRREQVGVVGHQRLHHVELRHAACAEVKQHPQRRGYKTDKLLPRYRL